MSALPAPEPAPEAGPASTIRLVPVPRHSARATALRRFPAEGQGTLSLDLPRAAPPPPLVDPAAWLGEEDEPSPQVDPGTLPDPRGWATMLAQAVVEVLAGRRPVAQLLRWVDPHIYQRVNRAAPQRPGRRGGVPVRVRRVRVSTTPDGTVEAVAVVDDGTRCRALAIRLEALHQRWMCTALEMV